MDSLILGIESFDCNIAASKGNYKQENIFLNPSTDVAQFSILWLWVSASYPQKIHPRHFFLNLWRRQIDCNSVQIASLGDIVISLELKTIITVNGWEIRALFLKPLLPTTEVVLSHPKGIERIWRSLVFTDPHLPLSHMLKFEAERKKPILITERYQIPEKSRTPEVWVKRKEGIDGTSSTLGG